MQRRCNPRIERTKADARSPHSMARSASPPHPKINAPQEYAHAADGKIGRAASKVSRANERLCSTRPISDRCVNKCWGIVGTERHCSVRVPYRSCAFLFAPSRSEMQNFIAKRRLPVREQVVRLELKCALEARQSLPARSVRAGGMGCAGQDKELGTLRAQILDRSRQKAVAQQRARNRTHQ